MSSENGIDDLVTFEGGSFNVRMAAELHKKAAKKALMMGISLNQLVKKAVEKEVQDL